MRIERYRTGLNVGRVFLADNISVSTYSRPTKINCTCLKDLFKTITIIKGKARIIIEEDILDLRTGERVIIDKDTIHTIYAEAGTIFASKTTEEKDE